MPVPNIEQPRIVTRSPMLPEIHKLATKEGNQKTQVPEQGTYPSTVDG